MVLLFYDIDVVSTSESHQRNKYKAGFSECVHEVTRYLDTIDCIDTSVRVRLSTHLVNCLNELYSDSNSPRNVDDVVSKVEDNGCGGGGDFHPSKLVNSSEARNWTKVVNGCEGGVAVNPLTTTTTSASLSRCATSSTQPPTLQPIQVHIPTTSIPINLITRGPGAGGGPALSHHPVSDTFLSSSSGGCSSSDTTTATATTTTTTIVHGLHLIPTQLSNGEIAFVLPPQNQQTLDNTDTRRHPLIQQQKQHHFVNGRNHLSSPSFAIVATTSSAVSDGSDAVRATTSSSPHLASKVDVLRPLSPVCSRRGLEDCCALPTTSSTDMDLIVVVPKEKVSSGSQSLAMSPSRDDAASTSSTTQEVGQQFPEHGRYETETVGQALVAQQDVATTAAAAASSPSKSMDLNCLMIKEESVWRPW